MFASFTAPVTLAFLSFPGWDAFWGMVGHAFWWGLAILAASILLIPVLVVVVLIWWVILVVLRESG